MQTEQNQLEENEKQKCDQKTKKNKKNQKVPLNAVWLKNFFYFLK